MFARSIVALTSISVASLLGACSGAAPDSADTADCGPRLLGITCQTADGSCEGLVCANGSWACPSADVQVPLTPQSCAH
jgi:hypothetical protein